MWKLANLLSYLLFSISDLPVVFFSSPFFYLFMSVYTYLFIYICMYLFFVYHLCFFVCVHVYIFFFYRVIASTQLDCNLFRYLQSIFPHKLTVAVHLQIVADDCKMASVLANLKFFVTEYLLTESIS